MYHVTEFTARKNTLQVSAAYTADTLPSGRAISRNGNAIRVVDPTRPDVEIIVSRPAVEGDVFPLPLYNENLGWAFK